MAGWWDSFKWNNDWTRAGDLGAGFLAEEPQAVYRGMAQGARYSTPQKFQDWLDSQFNPTYSRYKYALGTGENPNLSWAEWLSRTNPGQEWARQSPSMRGESSANYVRPMTWRI